MMGVRTGLAVGNRNATSLGKAGRNGIPIPERAEVYLPTHDSVSYKIYYVNMPI